MRSKRSLPFFPSRRWLVGIGTLPFAATFLLGPAHAQLPIAPSSQPTIVKRAQPDCEQPPTTLPPLLQVPQNTPDANVPPSPRNPGGEYDNGYFYLPERAPIGDDPVACGPAGRFWITHAFEMGWTKAPGVPALVHSGSPTGPVVYGDQRLEEAFRPGFSLTGGFWFDPQHQHGVDASFYYLSEGNNNTVFFSNGNSLWLPTASGSSFALADPATGYAGAYQAGLITRFDSADVNYRENILCSANGRLDAVAGYRFADLGEDYTIYGKRIGPDGLIERFRDDIRATNQFHGGQIGLTGEYRVGRWFATATGKVALGAVLASTDANGKFRVNTVVMPYGYYSRPGEEGPREYTRFGVMPTTTLTFGRQIGEHGRIFVGYNFLYLNNVSRGPDVVEPTPNVTPSSPFQLNLPPGNRRDSNISDFWASSINFGIEYRY